MKNKSRLYLTYTVLSFLLLFAMGGLAWFFSSQDGELSTRTSSFFLPLVRSLLPPSIASFVIRKAAHFTLYFATGLASALFTAAFSKFAGRPEAQQTKILMAVLICIVMAGIDELHQHFIPGRSGQFRDVLLDSSGSVLAICLFFGLAHHFTRKKGGH